MTIDFKALGAKAAATGVDMTKATQGGGDYEPPVAGPTRLRFIGYVELGKQKGQFKGIPTVKPKVQLIFELSGPKHPPVTLPDGTKMPHRVTVEENFSLNEKAALYKLFTRMNYAGTASHIAQLLGEAYKGTVVHRKYPKAGEDKADPSKWTGISVELKTKADGYTIQPPRFEKVDPETQEPTGEMGVLSVDPAISPLRCFIWDLADMEQWASIFIDGQYPSRTVDGKEVPGKSKNVFQARIMQAENFNGSPIHALLLGNGASLDVPDAEVPEGAEEEGEPAEQAAPAAASVPSGAAADDALNGIV